MKNVRRQPKKRSRARTFDELEYAFYDLVQKHNLLNESHRELQKRHNTLGKSVRRNNIDIDRCASRSYGIQL